MDPTLYNAINAGRAGFKRQEILANNLANVNTPGFKADLYTAQTMYMQNGINNANGQSYGVQTANGIDLTPGEIMTTGRDLDVAIDGNGFLAVRDSKGGESYTRAGSLHIDVNGQLLTASGKSVLGDGGPISIPPSKSIEIAPDGTISVVTLEGDVKSLAVLDRLKLVSLDKNSVVKGDDGSLRLKSGGSAKPDTSIRVLSGAVEGSNVKAVEEMVGMISAGREFEAHMKILSTVDDNAQRLASILHDE